MTTWLKQDTLVKYTISMTETDDQIHTIEQATSIDHLLTNHGKTVIKDGRNPYFFGNPVTEDMGFAGRKYKIDEIQQALTKSGAVILESGHRNGSTSLLKVAGPKIVENGLANHFHYFDLQAYAGESLSQLEKDLNLDLGEQFESGNSVIAFDEFNAITHPSDNPHQVIVLFKKLRDRGHKLLINVAGGINTPNLKNIPDDIKKELHKLSNGETVANTLMSDSETEKIIYGNEDPIFSEVATKYLVREAGGNPFLAALLASTFFDKIRDIQDGFSTFYNWQQELEDETSQKLSSYFEQNVRYIKEAGYDPQTWEYKGEGEPPDRKLFTSMIPRPTSTIFQNWLSQQR